MKGKQLAGWVVSVSLFLSVGVARAAERIYASYAVLERSISVSALEHYAKTGELDEDLAVYARYADEETLDRLREALTLRAEVDPIAISQFLYTPQGESLLRRLARVIRPPITQSPRQENGREPPGYFGLRAALLLAATDKDGLTLLNVLRQYPTRDLQVDLQSALQIANEVRRIVNRSRRAIALVEQRAADATADTEDPLDINWNSRSLWGETTTWTRSSESFEYYDLQSPDDDDLRIVNFDVYLPDRGESLPIAVISHGLGSDRGSFVYLAEYLAARGFAVAVPQHPGSDSEQLNAVVGGFAEEVAPPWEFVQRPLDVKEMLDRLEEMAQNEPEFRRLNVDRVGIIGQSFGGYTALAIAGATIDLDGAITKCVADNQENASWNTSVLLQCQVRNVLPKLVRQATAAVQLEWLANNANPIAVSLDKLDFTTIEDDRVKAAIAVNPISSIVFGSEGMSAIDIPTLIVAGGADTVAPALFEQIRPFTWLEVTRKYLVLATPGTHFSFLGESTQPPGENEGVIPIPPEVIGPSPAVAQYYLQRLSLAFLQTYVANNLEYAVYLQPAAVAELSQESVPIAAIDALSETELDEGLVRRTP